jgi:hypothetical protein
MKARLGLALSLVLVGCSSEPDADVTDAATSDTGSQPPLDGGNPTDDGSVPDDASWAGDGSPTSWDGGPAPAWFANAKEGEWIAIANAPSQRIRAVLPNPVPHVTNAPDNPGGIMTAWTGGGIDQVRGELMLVANGGHADYPGNEGYAISLREANPAWRRLSDPTPNDKLLTGAPGPTGALNADGRPRAMHSTFECFGDDRMWFVYDNAYTSPAGDSMSASFSYNRAFAGMPGPGGSPLPWTTGLGPWTIHPNPNANWTNGFGKAAWDRVGHKVWAVGGNNNINGPEYWSVDTSGPTIGTPKLYKQGGTLDNFNGWVAIAHDLRILVAGGSFTKNVFVLQLDQAGTSGAWQKVTSSTGTGFFDQGSGGAYVIANHTIAIANPKTTGSSIYRLKIPTKQVGGKDAYDPNGTWAWSKVTPPGVTLTPAPGNSDVNSKWGIVEDMGGNTSALVTALDIDGPVYVYKLPKTGL